MTGATAIIGTAGPLGRRVIEAVAADPTVERVVVPQAGDGRALQGVDVVVYLGGLAVDPVDGTGVVADPDLARGMLRQADEHAVGHLVVLSSGAVYGARDDNPVPLTEDAVMRPDPAFEDAVERAEVERLVATWREASGPGEAAGSPERSVTVLRPAPVVDPDDPSTLRRSPWWPSIREGEDSHPVQLLHVDDLAGAVDWARRFRLDGTFNVAPDDWAASRTLRSLAGPVPPPGPVGRTLAAADAHRLVLANDRLRQTGWAPRHTTEEVLVETCGPGWFDGLDAGRRQRLSLLAVGGVVAGGAVVVAALARRRRRRRR